MPSLWLWASVFKVSFLCAVHWLYWDLTKDNITQTCWGNKNEPLPSAQMGTTKRGISVNIILDKEFFLWIWVTCLGPFSWENSSISFRGILQVSRAQNSFKLKQPGRVLTRRPDVMLNVTHQPPYRKSSSWSILTAVSLLDFSLKTFDHMWLKIVGMKI